MEASSVPLTALLVALLLVTVAGLVLVVRSYIALRGQIAQIRRDTVRKSQAVIRGKVAEQLAPYLPDFPYNPKDARFIGSPIDFVVFDGLDEENMRSVVFVEVKTGSSGLTRRQRRVRDAVQAGDVEWKELRLSV